MQRIPYGGGRPPEAPDSYTLLLNSFRRHDLLKASIAHYASCPGLDAIRVVWCEDQVRSQSRVWHLGRLVRLRLGVQGRPFNSNDVGTTGALASYNA